MIFFVPDNGMMYGFGEQKSATRDRQSSLKLTKNVDVDGRHCATKSSTKSMDLIGKKPIQTIKMVQIISQRLFAHLCLTLKHFEAWGGGNCISDTKHSEREQNICKILVKRISNVI